MAQIIIPDRLAARLAHDEIWKSYVTQFKLNIAPLLAKDPDFFPDYTIHGIDHINRVLDIADRLIDYDTLSEEPQKTDLLTPRDVAFLVCGIMLHDMGMFLRPDGVRKLVKMASIDDAFGGKPWKDEWSNYVDRTKRLSQEKMRYHFGKVIPVTEDCVDHTDTDDNKRIIGEFLRQHHARLAHEFALDVLSGTEDTDLFANINLPPKARDVIGILARSHGMAIRDIELYVKNHIGEGTKPYNTPVFYLMTVLRTADALDADERRAPEALERQQKINVPISVEEWTWNQCIDPYACDWRRQQKNYYVEANPKSSPQYVQLDKWLKGVQADLDLCWSILAEKYSHPDERYRLSIHRVVSNIHEPGIQETMNEKFLTREAKITANPEIVKLMMEPLYDDDPTYGVRELLQNAVDACLEREYRENRESQLRNHEYKGKVTVSINTWKDPKTQKETGVFVIEDNGIGMDAEILTEYFLRVGSSYRTSDEWKQDFTLDSIPQISRTGRFGVGVMAVFLLGDSISVRTQRFGSDKGYAFHFSSQSTPLDIRRVNRGGPGTTIVIRLDCQTIEHLEHPSKPYLWYNWYRFCEPEVVYLYNGDRLPLHLTDVEFLSRTPTDNIGWWKLESNKYNHYIWTSRPLKEKPHCFFCNGIRIYDIPQTMLVQEGLNVCFPNISLIDPHFSLKVNLERSRVLEIPEYTNLVREVFKRYIAILLLTCWDTDEHYKRNLRHGFHLWDSGPSQICSVPFLMTKNGFSLNYASFFQIMGIDQYTILYYDSEAISDVIDMAYSFLPDTHPISIVMNSTFYPMHFPSPSDTYRYESNPAVFIASLATNQNQRFDHTRLQYQQEEHWTNLVLRNGIYKRTESYLQSKFPLDLQEHSNGFTTMLCPNQVLLQQPIDMNHFDPTRFPVALHMSMRAEDVELERNGDPSLLFPQLLQELLGPNTSHPNRDMWIPYDMQERKAKFPEAFKILDKYIKYYHPQNDASRITANQDRLREKLKLAEQAWKEAMDTTEQVRAEAIKLKDQLRTLWDQKEPDRQKINSLLSDYLNSTFGVAVLAELAQEGSVDPFSVLFPESTE